MTKKPKNVITVDGKLPALKAEISGGRKFLRNEIAPLLKLTGRSIQYYTDLGIVIPDIYNPTGKGTKRLYSEKNVFQLLLIQTVIKHGFKLSDIKPIINSASDQWIKNMKSQTIVISTRKVRISPEKYEVFLYEKDYLNLGIDLKDFESVLILDLSDIIKKIKTL